MDNPQAFPGGLGSFGDPNEGMTLRDWFAGQALAGICASVTNSEAATHIAPLAYGLADRMLAARKSGQPS